MVLEAIIFDLDGTIVNSHEVHWYAFNDYLKQFNIQISWIDWINKHLGEKSEVIWENVVGKHKIAINIDKAQVERREYYRRLVSEGKLKEINGFSKFFDWLKTTFKPPISTVIASNGHPSSIETSLEAIGYLHHIKYYSAECGSHKISKDRLLIKVVKDLQVTPQNCLVLEDSSLGATAAKKNGIKVIIINSSHLPESDFEANLIVDDYTDPMLFSYVSKLYNLKTFQGENRSR
ncbi:MAG: HAD family hydrolase [Candidatus Hodarchaeales archaeon]|jgi:beta-phosphoglucomutase-like phosphatase (HAD superfamily)